MGSVPLMTMHTLHTSPSRWVSNGLRAAGLALGLIACMHTAQADEWTPVLSGGLGAAAGAVIGHAMGGRDGAILGAGVGGAAGVVIGSSVHAQAAPVYTYAPAPHYQSVGYGYDPRWERREEFRREWEYRHHAFEREHCHEEWHHHGDGWRR